MDQYPAHDVYRPNTQPVKPLDALDIKLSNYLIQAATAEVWRRAFVTSLLEQGYTEIAPGVLCSPDESIIVEE
jgi:hypothetical protein